MPAARKSAAGRSREAAKALRRGQLIRSTIDAIAKRGLAGTTLAEVADGAGLSRGLVNFHFSTKQALLVETLTYLSDEYRDTWQRALERAGADPATRLAAVVSAEFDPLVCSRKKIAVWHAFYGEARARPTYRKLCDSRDLEHHEAMREACRALMSGGDYGPLDPERAASGVTALTDGLWLDILLHAEGFSREAALGVAMAFLARLFPGHFEVSAQAPSEPR